MHLTGTLFEALGRFGSRVVGSFTVPWEDVALAEVFHLRIAPNKHGVQLWAAGRYKEGTNRGLVGLIANTAAVFDADCLDVGQADVITAYLKERGLAYLMYSSWGHGDPAKEHKGTGKRGPYDCIRLVFPYTREVSEGEHRVITAGMLGHEIPDNPPHYAAEMVGVSLRYYARGWDPVSTRPAQAYFLPSCPPEREALSLYEFSAGLPIDVDAVLARPTTRRLRERRERAHVAPTAQAIGALSDLVEALTAAGHWVGAPNAEGWQRTACPNCAPGGVQKSPSCTFRASGDEVRVHCHSHCSPSAILESLGLREDARYEDAGSLRDNLDDQLLRQTSPHEELPVDAAVERLVIDLRAALEAREPTVLKYPCGTGKSVATAKVIAERVAQGRTVIYATQEHKVAAETRSLLPPDVRARSVHLHSPLVQVDGAAQCSRAAEVGPRVFELGLSLRGNICPKCPQFHSCPAVAEHKARHQARAEAAVIFCSHAGIRQIFPPGTPPAGYDFIVDETPAVFDSVTIARGELAQFVSPQPLPSAYAAPARAAFALARAWLVGRSPGLIDLYDGQPPVPVLDVAAEWGAIGLRPDADPSLAEQPWLSVAARVLRVGAFVAQGGSVTGLEGGTGDVTAMVPDACQDALVRQRGVLLSATPLAAALPGFVVRDVPVKDAAPVRRVMVLRRHRGLVALTKDIPWDVVRAALDRACGEALSYSPARVLFVSFKGVIDALRKRPDILAGRDIELGHFGALRGKNDWMEHRPKECSVVYCLGAPRMGMHSTLRALGMDGQALQTAWVDYAAGELDQALGRLRLPRRTKPCCVVVEGDVAPASWTALNVDEVDIDKDAEK